MQTLRDTVIQILNSTAPNYDAAREVIGQYLHLLQMFYSNTNWVELSGSIIYRPLGKKLSKFYLQRNTSILSSTFQLLRYPSNQRQLDLGFFLENSFLIRF
jgi:hypothetical protein